MTGCSTEPFSTQQVEDFVTPKQESVEAVNAWLKENNIETTKASPAGDWFSFSVPVSKANELLDANFAVFEHTSSGKQMVRTLSYSIPADLQDHLELVHPTVT